MVNLGILALKWWSTDISMCRWLSRWFLTILVICVILMNRWIYNSCMNWYCLCFWIKSHKFTNRWQFERSRLVVRASFESSNIFQAHWFCLKNFLTKKQSKTKKNTVICYFLTKYGNWLVIDVITLKIDGIVVKIKQYILTFDWAVSIGHLLLTMLNKYWQPTQAFRRTIERW